MEKNEEISGNKVDKDQFLIQVQQSIEEQQNLNELIQTARENFTQQQNLQQNLQNMRQFFDDLGKQCFTVSELIVNLQELSEKFQKSNQENQKMQFHRQQKEKIDLLINQELQEILGSYQSYSDEVLLKKIDSLKNKYQEVNKQKQILKSYLEEQKKENQWVYSTLDLKVKNIRKINKNIQDLTDEFNYFLENYMELDQTFMNEVQNRGLEGELDNLINQKNQQGQDEQKIQDSENPESLEKKKKIRKLSIQEDDQKQNLSQSKNFQKQFTKQNESQNKFIFRDSFTQDQNQIKKCQNQNQNNSFSNLQKQNSLEQYQQEFFTHWNTEAEVIDALDDLKQEEKQFKDFDIDYSFLNQDLVQQLFQESAFCCYGHSFAQNQNKDRENNSPHAQSLTINKSNFNLNLSKYLSKEEMEERNLG